MSPLLTADHLELTPLRATDALLVRRWLSAFIKRHARGVDRAARLGWTSAELDAQLVATDVIDRVWSALGTSAGGGDFVRVARMEDRAVGVVWAACRESGPLGLPVGAIHWVWVTDGCRGQGIGTRLVQEARAWMAGRALTAVEVRVSPDDEAGCRLMRRCGLSPAELRFVGPVVGSVAGTMATGTTGAGAEAVPRRAVPPLASMGIGEEEA